MKKIKTEELKRIQMEILEYLDSFCKKNNIQYWLDCGTLLGAIRHKGYIPWDDDIDVGMLREDYNKFISLSSSFNDNEKYIFKCYEIDKNWKYQIGKILDNSTVLYEPDEKHGIKTAVNIDIFVHDNAPSNDKELRKMYDKRDLYIKLNKCQNIKRFYTEEKQKYNFIRYPIYYFFKIFPKNYFVKKLIDNSMKLKDKNTGYVGFFMGIAKTRCPISVFKSFVSADFEGKKFPIPKEYDKWLKKLYGDYMKLPPVEKQKTHHNFVAYYKDKEVK